MNRENLLELAERIEGNAWMMRRFLHDPDMGDIEVAIEILGRIGIIESKVSQIRQELAREEPRNNVHVLGDRPSPDAA